MCIAYCSMLCGVLYVRILYVCVGARFINSTQTLAYGLDRSKHGNSNNNNSLNIMPLHTLCEHIFDHKIIVIINQKHSATGSMARWPLSPRCRCRVAVRHNIVLCDPATHITQQIVRLRFQRQALEPYASHTNTEHISTYAYNEK